MSILAPQYRSKPVTIQAVQMPAECEDRAGMQAAVREIAEWMVDHGYQVVDPDVEIADADPDFVYGDQLLPEYGVNFLEIVTFEGTMTAKPGDWIILGTVGEFYPCKDEVFQAKYGLVLGAPAHEAPALFGKGSDRQVIAVELEGDARRAIEDFLLAHDAELHEALAQHGVDWGAVLQPAWMRAVSARELTAALEGAVR